MTRYRTEIFKTTNRYRSSMPIRPTLSADFPSKIGTRELSAPEPLYLMELYCWWVGRHSYEGLRAPLPGPSGTVRTPQPILSQAHVHDRSGTGLRSSPANHE